MKKLLLLPAIMMGITITLYAQVKEKELPPPPAPPKVELVKFSPPIIVVEGKQADEFYKRNPSVASISRQGNIITLGMKDNSTEKYNMGLKSENKSFTDKYGKAPIPNPPPPPPKVAVNAVKPPPPPSPPKVANR